MHEASAVEVLLEHLLQRLGADAPRARLIRLRAGAGTAPEALRNVFRALSQGTPLAAAELRVEVDPAQAACRCGKRVAASPEDSETGWMLCPACGAPVALPHSHRLEVMGIELAREAECRPHAGHSSP